MGSSRVLLALVIAAAGCRRSDSSSAPQVSGDGGAGPPGAGKKSGPGVIDDAASSAKDSLGDPLPRGAVARLGSLRLLDRHLENMRFLPPAGAQLVSASYDRYVVWDAASGRRVFELERTDPGPAMALSPSGKLLATSVAGSSEVQIWDLAARRPLQPVRAEREVVALCYLGENVVAAGSSGLVAVIGSSEKKPLRVTGAFNKLTSMACGGGGQVIALGDDSGAVFAVDLRKGLLAAVKLGASPKRVSAVAVSPDGSRVAAASDDASAYLYRLEDPARPIVIQAHDRAVSSIAFSSDGKTVWTSGGDHWLRAWNPDDGVLRRELEAADGLTLQYMAISPDGKRAATWSQHRGAKGSEAGRFWLWELATGDSIAEPERHDHPLTGIAFSPDGTLIATSSEDQTVRLWEAGTGKSRTVLTSPQAAVNAVHFGKDSAIVYSAGGDGRLVAWRHADDHVADALPPIGGKVNAFAIAGDRAVTGDETGRVWTWDLGAKTRLQALDRRTYASVTSVAISPDGKRIAMAGSERIVLVIGADSGSEVARLTPDVVSNLAVAFSPDGALLATAGDDGKVRLWDTKTWKEARALGGHDGTVRAVAFSPDGKRVASGSNDTTARVWEVATGAQVAELSGHGGAVTGVAFSPDGKRLATASHDRTGLVWALP
ncbi:MAG TPA: WD40 repeat domain-containing protein [Kofleriaceae bacterium]|nr:WD40 repeat domain-containing protein [Kofleriaceae bacterium]